MTTCERSQESNAMSSQPDSPARTSAMPESEKVSAEVVLASGITYRQSFAHYDRDSSCWRTWQRCLDEEWGEFLETWPRSGTTWNGIAYQRQQLARCTTGTEFGLRLIPTPTACDHKGSGRLRLERGENNNLRDWFKIRFNFLYPPVACVAYLMGYPTGWASLKDTATPSSRKSRQSSSKLSKNAPQVKRAQYPAR